MVTEDRSATMRAFLITIATAFTFTCSCVHYYKSKYENQINDYAKDKNIQYSYISNVIIGSKTIEYYASTTLPPTLTPFYIDSLGLVYCFSNRRDIEKAISTDRFIFSHYVDIVNYLMLYFNSTVSDRDIVALKLIGRITESPNDFIENLKLYMYRQDEKQKISAYISELKITKPINVELKNNGYIISLYFTETNNCLKLHYINLIMNLHGHISITDDQILFNASVSEFSTFMF